MTTTAPTFIDTFRSKIEALKAERFAAQTEMDTVLAAPATEGRSEFTDAEESLFVAARDKLQEIDTRRAAADTRLAELEALDAEQRRIGQIAPARPQDRVTRNESTYRQNGEHSFLADLYAQHERKGDYRAAEERLGRHEKEVAAEYRDTFVAGMAGMVPPKYLVDQYAPAARAGRPFLNSLNSMSLPPDGMTFYIPKVTATAIPTSVMVTEGSGFVDIDTAVTNDTMTVRLIGVQEDVSRTLFERGAGTVDRIIFPDLIGTAEIAENVSAIKGSGVGESFTGVTILAGTNGVTYTDASPTVGELWSKLADAIQRINTLRFLPATAIYMHPRRWGWITAALDTTNRPLMNFSSVPPQDTPIALGSALMYGQVVGTMMGLPVITDASIPTTNGAGTNEDVIIVARASDIVLWEDPLMRFTFEQAPPTAPGQIRLAVGRFCLFHAGRYAQSISIISGTGLVSPTF